MTPSDPMHIPNISRRLQLLALAAGLGASVAHAAILVGLDPGTALYDSNLKGLANDGGTAGSQSGIPVLGDPEHLNGLTFNIAFTPNTADLERAMPADARTVLLIEIGGTSNGFGLYLVDGVPTVLSKQTAAWMAFIQALYASAEFRFIR